MPSLGAGLVLILPEVKVSLSTIILLVHPLLLNLE